MKNYHGKPISNNEIQQELVDVNLKGKDGEYKILDESNLNELGISNTQDTYIVNYKTGEVINRTNYNSFERKLYLSAE